MCLRGSVVGTQRDVHEDVIEVLTMSQYAGDM